MGFFTRLVFPIFFISISCLIAAMHFTAKKTANTLFTPFKSKTLIRLSTQATIIDLPNSKGELMQVFFLMANHNSGIYNAILSEQNEPPTEIHATPEDQLNTLTLGAMHTKKALIYLPGSGEISESFLESASQHFDLIAIPYYLEARPTNNRNSSEEITLSLAESTIRFIKGKNFNNKQIFLVGEGVGSVVALHLASTQKISKVFMLNPILGYKEQCRQMFGNLLCLNTKQQFSLKHQIAKITQPTTVIFAQQDAENANTRHVQQQLETTVNTEFVERGIFGLYNKIVEALPRQDAQAPSQKVVEALPRQDVQRPPNQKIVEALPRQDVQAPPSQKIVKALPRQNVQEGPSQDINQLLLNANASYAKQQP